MSTQPNPLAQQQTPPTPTALPGPGKAPMAQPPDSGAGGGFFSRLGSGLKKVMPYLQPALNRLAAAAGNYGPIELEHQQKELELKQAHEKTQDQLAQSQMQTQELNRQLLTKEVSGYEDPTQKRAAEVTQAGALEREKNINAPPTDVVAPMEAGGMGHYNRKFNPQTNQWEVSPTMVPSAPVANPTQATTPSPMPSVGPQAPATPAIPPPLMGRLTPPSPTVTPAPHQLPAMSKPASAAGDIEPDGGSPTGFSRVWRDAGLNEIKRVASPAPSAYVGSTTSGESTVLKDTPEGQVPVQLPHSSTKTPVPPGGAGAPPTLPTVPSAGGVHVGAPVLPSSKQTEWVSWQTPDGRTVAGSAQEALSSGAQNPTKVPAQEVRDITNARMAVRLMTKQGDPTRPETNGVLQLIDSLEKEGKLGILASRWNALMTTGVGAAPGDDPRIVTLINKNMLGDTATMLAHFGASGGRSPQMLQHFLDLANAKKMDGPTLKAGVMSMVDYMTDRAMLAGTPGNTYSSPATGGGSFAQWKASQPQR